MSEEAFAKLSEQMRELETRRRTGRGESPEADALRDEMDTYWYQLTPEEQDKARQFSASLQEMRDPMQPWMEIAIAARALVQALSVMGTDHPEVKKNLDFLNREYATYNTRFYVDGEMGLCIFTKHDLEHFPKSDAPIQMAGYVEQLLDVPAGHGLVLKYTYDNPNNRIQGTTRLSIEHKFQSRKSFNSIAGETCYGCGSTQNLRRDTETQDLLCKRCREGDSSDDIY